MFVIFFENQKYDFLKEFCDLLDEELGTCIEASLRLVSLFRANATSFIYLTSTIRSWFFSLNIKNLHINGLLFSNLKNHR